MPSATPSFAIILTTFNRPELVIRAVKSAVTQTVAPSHILVVNDSPEAEYAVFERYVPKNPVITYVRNDQNIGKNNSVNKALDILSARGFGGYIIFLDDDDWLDKHCLAQFTEAIVALTPDQVKGWIISNRTTKNGKTLTYNGTSNIRISYYRDYLIAKRFSGDATHCILFAETMHCRFAQGVKNGEEWLYYSQVAKRFPLFLYIPFTGTWTEGYYAEGLTKSRMTFMQKYGVFQTLSQELSAKHFWNTYTRIYMLLRLMRLLIPKKPFMQES